MHTSVYVGLALLAVLSGALLLAWFKTPVSPEGFKAALATVFWVGEEAGPENGHIANDVSAWDSSWQERFGGVDDPRERCGHAPCAFTPQENPFYFALPYNDLDDTGAQKENATRIPWFGKAPAGESLVKNRWIEVRLRGERCFAQWEDVGPFESDDAAYVFGTSSPKNTAGVGAGIDISPAVRDCLHMDGNEVVFWKFTEEEDVTEGPWREVITSTGVMR